MLKRFAIALSAMILVACSDSQSGGREVLSKPEWVKELNERFDGPSGLFHDESYKSYLADYTSSGDYLNWGAFVKYKNDSEILMHESGLPQVVQDGVPYWNAVTLSHFAMVMYGRMIRGDETARPLLNASVAKLIELQNEKGGFPYPSRTHRWTVLPDGWISAMAQGNALSAFVRSLKLKDDPVVHTAAERAFLNLMLPVKDGGAHATMADFDKSLSSDVFFPEYPSDPLDYTLNGYMFTLLGIYDWSQVSSNTQSQAKAAFSDGVRTLVKILPFYDIDGFSTYDLAHYIDPSVYPKVHEHYLGIHVYLLHALYSVTKEPVLKKYEDIWASKIDEMNRPLRLTSMIVEPQNSKVGDIVRVTLDAQGGDDSAKQFRLAVKDGDVWFDITQFSTSPIMEWRPDRPGNFILGFYVRNEDSSADFDNFRYVTVTVQ